MLLAGHFQNAYITRDLDRAMALIRDRFGVGEIKHFESAVEVTTPSGSGTAVMKTAFAWAGNLQYELIEPVSGMVGIYRDALGQDDHVLHFHHVCMRVDDFDRTRADIDEQKLPVVFEGVTSATKFLYVDARDSLGHYLEYVWMPPQVWEAMGGR